ncbi:RNA polymerase sigma factor [Hymenobacter sp. ASUV-10]|uniref:RNA polymerase sigma factor n=1 Tax=Hymenobacter aranciens TaxID=3063996 RepID=A0ABT9BHE5_9BACT|nr:RNA polymerase sigma factor [Hymenobacter sp. ASUV-10]MDO7877679.1 RNA polymerase sigma factor [Hymenobacter sp. ASUV-10]
MPLSEEELVERLIARDEQAMTAFYNEHHKPLYTVIFRLVRNAETTEDVLQEGLVKLWQTIKLYDATKGRLFTWATRICCNVAIDYLRSKRHRMAIRTQPLEDSPVDSYSSSDGFQPETVGIKELVQQLPLPAAHLQLLDLLYIQGFTQVEAAEEMQIPLGTVKTWTTKAKKFLARLDS